MSKSYAEIDSLTKEKKRCEKKGKLLEVAQHCSAIGEEYAKLGLYDKAIEQHNEELLLCEALNDQLGLAFANRKLGECFAEKGEFDKAFAHEKRYLEISQHEGSDIEEQRAYATLGRTYFLQIDTIRDDTSLKDCLKKAESAYLSSLEVCERLKPNVSEATYMEMKARLLLNLGVLYDVKNDLDLCAKYLKEAIKIAEKYNFTADRLRCNITLASIYQRNGSYDKALYFLDLALKCAQQLKDKGQQVEVYCQKALIYLHQENIEECKKNCKKAYKIKTGNEEDKKKVEMYLKSAIRLQKYISTLSDGSLNTKDKMTLYEKLGDTTANLGVFEKALCYYENMLKCGQTVGLEGKALVPAYVSLAQTYQDLKNYPKAIEMYKKEIECQRNNYVQVAKSYLNIAECVDKIEKDYEKLDVVYRKAIEFAEKAQCLKLKKQILHDLVVVQKHYNHTDEANKTEQILSTLGVNEDDDDEDIEEDDSQNTEHNQSDVDLQLLSSSEEEDNEEFDRAASKVGVARRTGYKIKRNEKGETELHTACIQGNIKRVESLIDRGHPVNARDCAGWLPIHEACNHGWPSVVECLIKRGANVNDRGGTHCDGTTPLLDVCGVACAKVDCKKAADAATYVQRHVDIIHMLIKAGANVHAKDIDANTALDLLIEQRKLNMDDLTWEEIPIVKRTEKYLKAVMQGNNPHLALDNISTVHSESEEDSLPEITSKKKKSATVPIIEDESQNMNASDSESDSENVRTVADELATLSKHPEKAPLAYKNAMKEIGRSAVHNIGQQQTATKAKVKSRALLTCDEYVGDSWLEDDLGKSKSGGKRKRNDPSGVLSTSGVRKKSRMTEESDNLNQSRSRIRKISEESSDSYASEQEEQINLLNENDLVPKLPDIIGGHEDMCKHDTGNKSVAMTTTQRNNHVYGDTGSRIPTSQILEELFDCEMDDISCSSGPINYGNTVIQTPSLPDNRLPVSQRNKKSHQVKITSFVEGVPRTNKQMSSDNSNIKHTNHFIPHTQMPQTTPIPQSTGLLMRLRVKVNDKQILVPVPKRPEPVTLGWVAEETSKRYYQLCHLRPVLSLTTKDGAMYAPEDLVVDLCLDNDELHSVIERWDLPPIGNRYSDACKSNKTVAYTNVKRLLIQCSSTGSLNLQQLSLTSKIFHPVAKALQHQSALKEIYINGNKLGDDGIKHLVTVLPTLPSLTTLDLAVNQITCNGLKQFLDGIENSSTGSTGKPLQNLEKLNFGYNSLGDSCTLTIAKLIGSLPALSYISFAACDFTVHFFQQNRINLAQAFKESVIQEIDFSMNHLGCTGVELLLMCIKPDFVCKLHLANTVNIASINNFTKYIENYITQESCVLQELYLDGCHLLPEGIADLKRCLEVNTTLQHLSLSSNKKLCTSDIADVIQGSVLNIHSRLQSINCMGCNINSPLTTDFLDSISDKLHHNVPLRGLELTVGCVSKCDIDTLVQEIWLGKWEESAVCDIKKDVIKLGVKQEY